MSEVLSPKVLAAKLGISHNTLYKHLRSGRLPGRLIGRKWFISADAMERLIAAGNQAQPQTAETRQSINV